MKNSFNFFIIKCQYSVEISNVFLLRYSGFRSLILLAVPIDVISNELLLIYYFLLVFRNQTKAATPWYYSYEIGDFPIFSTFLRSLRTCTRDMSSHGSNLSHLDEVHALYILLNHLSLIMVLTTKEVTRITIFFNVFVSIEMQNLQICLLRLW